MRRIACACTAAMCIGFTTPASAALMMATYTGTVTRGYDAMGAFGAPGSPIGFSDPGGNLAGLSYVATYEYDTSIGTRISPPGSGYDAVGGGTAVVGAPPSPILAAALTINGSTYQFATGTYAVVGVSDGTLPSGNFLYAYAISDLTPATDMTLSFNPGVAIPVNQVDAPFSLSFPSTLAGYARNYDPATDTYGFAMDLAASSVTVQTLGSSPSASVAQLAQASADVYNNSASSIGEFQPLGAPRIYSDGLKIQTYEDANNHIIVSIRGTDFNSADVGKNLIVDGATGSGINNAVTISNVDEAVLALKEIAAANPNATIQLTGHSLGGTIAQALGDASHLPTAVFDAPGSREIEFANSTSLQSLPVLGNASDGTNYRLYGDQFSLFGTQTGRVVTVDNGTLCCTPTSLGDIQNALLAHSPITLANLIAAGAPAEEGVTGPQYWTDSNILIPIAGSFAAIVSGTVGYWLDPAPGSVFAFYTDPGSPYFSSALLPSLEGISKYNLSYEVGDQWSSWTELAPLSQFDFTPGVHGFRFSALDQSGNETDISQFFLVKVTFASDGLFSGSLSITPGGVPEPNEWSLLLVGFGLLGWAFRRQRQMTRTNLRAQALG